MRTLQFTTGVALLLSTAATAASADYYLKIDSVARETPQGFIYLKAKSTGDLDGDGRPDTAVIRLNCAAGVIHAAQYQVISPRDQASGQATGKRMHKPFTIVKEWDAATPQLMAMKAGYDIKKVEGTGARMMATDDWSPITLTESEPLCAEASAAAAVKTRSNIQNN
ncbi:type VI secretion system tube protein Hcp [Sphingomonas sp. URHD0057]|uniref:type VI secretion system tube protein Hcp n=1 Tax=Sphingomonas sp. URHD0057 TaxID=1380389 RepID=UPI00048FC07A|nr:type VI secretion system tube protein Hcp [Sphingomonas sp. URHD0057]